MLGQAQLGSPPTPPMSSSTPQVLGSWLKNLVFCLCVSSVTEILTMLHLEAKEFWLFVQGLRKLWTILGQSRKWSGISKGFTILIMALSLFSTCLFWTLWISVFGLVCLMFFFLIFHGDYLLQLNLCFFFWIGLFIMFVNGTMQRFFFFFWGGVNFLIIINLSWDWFVSWVPFGNFQFIYLFSWERKGQEILATCCF